MLIFSSIAICRKVVSKGKISVTNNAFAFTSHHPLLLMAMTSLSKSYDPRCWGCIGPELITNTMINYTGSKLVQNIPADSDVNYVPLVR